MAEATLVRDKPGFGSDPTEELISEGRGYSKDYWDLVFDQLAKRKLFKLGMVVLAILYATAIYAPLIANDRPYVLEAIDYKEYKGALRTLTPVTMGTARRAAQTPEEYLAARTGDDAPLTQALALEIDRGSVADRISTIERYLPPEAREPLEVYAESIYAAIDAALAGDRAAAEAAGDEAKDIARALRKDLEAREPGGDPGGDPASGVELRPYKSYPLMESLGWGEILFMVLWALVMTWPLWNTLLNKGLLGGDRERIRTWRKRKVLFVLGASTLAAWMWAAFVGGGGDAFDTAPYKKSLTAGEIELVSEPVWPPLAFGYAETHPEEMFRAPTWKADAEIDAEGHYVRGPRVPPPPDPVTGYVPPGNPVEVRAGEPDANDPWRHPAGVDELGRDFLTRMVWGGRVSLSVGVLSAVLLTFIGVVLGSLAGYFGGWVDLVIMRVIEILQSIPAFFLILMTMAFTDPKVLPPILAIVIVIAMIRWTGTARLVRGEFLRLREAEFVVASRALGFSSARTIFRHVLPNALSPVLVSAAFAVAAGILTESAISFLGFGIAHPGASWGSLVNESKSPEHWWIQVFPGLLIFLTVTCYNLVGDAVRDALDPKMKV